MSSLIFVAVAVAWLVYLVPKVREHHDESLRSRTVSTFSHTIRVLARREPVSGRTTRLVAGARPVAADGPAPAGRGPSAETREQRASKPGAAMPKTAKSRSAAKRRRNVFAVLVLANGGVAAAAGFAVIGWLWMAAPVVLLLAWLVACRLMVRRERAVRSSRPGRGQTPLRQAGSTAAYAIDDETGEISMIVEERAAEVDDSGVAGDEAGQRAAAATGSWDPVAVPLPTYVSKPPAVRRTVRTIDLDSTGVWSSGRSESDSALAREADAARRDARDDQSDRRATGS